MDIKYNKTITIFFLSFFFLFFVSFSNKKKNTERKNKLNLILTIDKDTCYYDNSLIKLSLSLINNKNFPFFVRNSMPVSSINKANEMLLINIQKDDKFYVHASSIIDKNVSISKFMILKNKPYKRHYILQTNKLIEKKQADSLILKLGAKYYKMVDNKAFGRYKVQVIYLNPKIDTVYSNIVNITYIDHSFNNYNSNKDTKSP
jgi:hypothetical protein